MSTEFIPAAHPIIGEDEVDAVSRVIRSGMVAQGPETAAFEQEFSEQMVGGAHCVAVNSGTSALHTGLLAAGVGPGDEVIVPSFTFAATGNSVALTGATPVFADIEDDYFCLDPASVEAAITDKTVGIMPVHLYGHPANMDALGKIAEKHGLKLFEDAAQAHGATWGGRPVGTFGAFGAFSFYPTKNMTAGEGGMITTGDGELARLAAMIRNQGMEKRYANEVVGLNNRMTDINAAIGRVQLAKVGEWTRQRQENAAFLTENLEGVVAPKVAPEATHVYHQYTIRVSADRDGFVAALKDEHGIGSGVYYPIPNHRLPSLAPYAPGLELPHTEKAAAEVISLPVYPSLTREQLERIVTAVNAVAKAGA
ncbi:DegT/DnrJ/EryC1/StrS family aminotransferase [Nanchangia anserum]|uniref:DegT/DnrJ/EryC1/StrS family aminotransferase n=1 Tax=Nanchangia anserum TaxID=2692125 RepID=A0A8I0GDS5_9ACTO|nr:DegT/DnrJ/EryC1/StrS family aminotransferase [Nanchangia anserum]MBD3690116.1 DegT/DnrJ/EryC1/StrS family aminotransferase [Nanchangia anserum]QOX82099.1 DegT/DnrJ/EryC1/StrS family aminotransferase [Nanchangia anserum]